MDEAKDRLKTFKNEMPPGRAEILLPPKEQCQCKNRLGCFFKPGCSFEPSANFRCIRTNASCMKNNSEYKCHRYADCKWEEMGEVCLSDFNQGAVTVYMDARCELKNEKEVNDKATTKSEQTRLCPCPDEKEQKQKQKGAGRKMVHILGRDRVVRRVGRKQMVTYKGSSLSLTEARALEKQLQRQRKTQARNH
jgi:hypothetical protein